MEGRIDVSDEPRVTSEGVPAEANGRRAQPRFRERHARRLDGDGRCVRAREGRRRRRAGARQAEAARPAPTGSAATPAAASRKGTLTSVPFRVTQPYASFLVSGGAFTSTRVDCCSRRSQPGRQRGTASHLHDLRRQQRRRCARSSSTSRRTSARTSSIRLVDDETGPTVAAYLKESPWAHINFDHFRFHDDAGRSSPPRSPRPRSARCRRWTRSCTPASRRPTRRRR